MAQALPAAGRQVRARRAQALPAVRYREVRRLPATTAGRGTGTGSGTAGRSGTPGMMSPGAGKGGGKDDESTKGIPDYLITQEHGDELTGLDTLPKMVPPVIGAD